MLRVVMTDEELDEQQHLAEVTERLRAGRERLAMTIYTLQHRRRTPDQVAALLDRATRALRKSRMVKSRWKRHFTVH